ncbi:melatonin receptor type 1A-like [Gigantopelta aegis]|uniref:melatonin receptor type 1A-like n=1 Tax=Gigantopelta aegis TaxID=1735272 RepID=UPI001B88A9F4|nr:melatonin receptor type 1A-like [Gigantopelta aegis]XP_041377907.1 melatonin receptor type 1A-like [Gigantopelta aegis]XP_041377908.1 melatonin receptor type 1A-like [Gigantopelta aegis]
MNLAEKVIEGTILSIIWIFTFLGNISLWIIILRTRGLREQSYHMLLILSFADLLVSAVSMPITVVTIAAGDWLFSDATCIAIGFLTMLTFIASVMSLGAISLNRYVKICQARHYQRIYTSRNVALMAVGVWTLSLLLAMPPLIGWGKYDFLPTQSFCFCDWKASVSYTIFMITMCFGGPCTVMTFCYVNILRVFRKSTDRLFGSGKSLFKSSRCLGKVSQDPSSVSHGKIEIKIVSVSAVDSVGQTPAESENHEISSQNLLTVGRRPSQKKVQLSKDSFSQSNRDSQTERRALRRRHEEYVLAVSLLLVIFIFIVCWLPFCIAMFITVFSPNKVPRAFDMFALLLGYANSSCNPIIYGFMNKRFKREYWKLFRYVFSHCCKRFAVEDDSFDRTAVGSQSRCPSDN